jgi:hypothetical protein
LSVILSRNSSFFLERRKTKGTVEIHLIIPTLRAFELVEVDK